ncbi:MAG: hypothetical protein M3011_10575, partial [Actinomycetota bacterium]|nr:hypothetical protein [Actinomycetota bacterium]
VGRGWPGGGSSTGDEDPDDDGEFDLSAPLQFHMSAPQLPETGHAGFDEVLTAPMSALAVADALAGFLGDAFRAGTAMARDTAKCAICGDRFPAAHLLVPSGQDDSRVCPACIFDGDLADTPEVGYLAYQIDQLLGADLAAPAGWAAVAALLSATGPPGLHKRLESAWREAGTYFVPMPAWDDAGAWWIWVSTPTGPLAAMAPGASVAHLAEHLDRAYPGRRQRAARYFRAITRQRLTPGLWMAAVAYVVAFDSQARNRPRRREPWHVLESFDAFPYEWGVEDYLIPAAIDAVRKHYSELLGLQWDDYLHSDATPERRGLAAAYRFADSCEERGWQVAVDDDDDEFNDGPVDDDLVLRVGASSHMGAYRLTATWHEDGDGRGRFAGASFLKHDFAEPMALKTLREATRLAELYGRPTDANPPPPQLRPPA